LPKRIHQSAPKGQFGHALLSSADQPSASSRLAEPFGHLLLADLDGAERLRVRMIVNPLRAEPFIRSFVHSFIRSFSSASIRASPSTVDTCRGAGRAGPRLRTNRFRA